MRSGPRDDHIIEVAKAQVDGVSGSRTKGRLQRECEQQGTKRIALLDPTSRRHDPVPEAQVPSLAVAVVGPAGNSWQMLTRARKEGLAAHRVECIPEVKPHQHMVRRGSVARSPLAGSVDGCFGPCRGADADLQAPKTVAGLLTNSLAKELAHEPP